MMHPKPDTPLMSDQNLPTLKELAGSLPSLAEGMDVEDVIKQAKFEHYLRANE